jgi:hypothetical protein
MPSFTFSVCVDVRDMTSIYGVMLACAGRTPRPELVVFRVLRVCCFVRSLQRPDGVSPSMVYYSGEQEGREQIAQPTAQTHTQ